MKFLKEWLYLFIIAFQGYGLSKFFGVTNNKLAYFVIGTTSLYGAALAWRTHAKKN